MRPIIDYLVVMPLDEEFGYVRDVIQPLITGRIRSKTIGSELYAKVIVPTATSEASVVLLSVGRMTEAPVQSAVTDAIRLWRPATTMLVGIAGSLDAKEIRLGDVIVPRRVFGYTEAKAAVVDKKERVRYRPTGHQLDCELSTLARAISMDHAKHWRETARRAGLRMPKLRPKLLTEEGTAGPRLHLGNNDCLASGNIVIASRRAAKELLQIFGDDIGRTLRAVEMEAKGLCEALDRVRPAPPALVVRGISDYADEKKAALEKTSKDGWRRYAAQNAARFLLLLMKLRPEIAEGYKPVAQPVYPMQNHPDSTQMCLRARINARDTGMKMIAFSPFWICSDGLPETTVKVQPCRADGATALFADVLLRHQDDQKILVRAAGVPHITYTFHRTGEPSPVELLVGLSSETT
jgi:nucleoside phosphorylase